VLVRYDVGAIDDPVGQEGVAHIASHVSYAPTTGALTLWDKLDHVATWIDTKPDLENTDFTEQCEVQQLPIVLRVEAERLARRCDGVTDAWFAWLRMQVREELRANTTRLTNRTVSNVVYGASSPYGRAYDATPVSIDAITRDQTCEFMDRHFSPTNVLFVVSGPVDPAAFEQMFYRELGSVPARSVAPRAPRPALGTTGSRTAVRADVAQPTLVIAWALPKDEAKRAVMTLAIDLVAETLKGSIVSDPHYVMLWLDKNEAGVDATIAKVREALGTELIAPKEFEKTRLRRISGLLARLDAIPTRLSTLARGGDLNAPFDGLEQVSPQGFDAIVAADLAWSRARVIELQPDGTRPRWHPASLVDPVHSLRGPSSFLDTSSQLTIASSTVLAHARTFRLANGLSVILVPTSPIPLVDIRLAFNAGVAAEPPDHRGTATVAIAALEEVANRGLHTEESSWAVAITYSGAGNDSSGIAVRGPTTYIDLLMNQFEGLGESQYEPSDVDKGREALARTAASPVHRLWDEQAAVRATVYGANHPYARAKAPDPRDVTAFDAREVEKFYRRYLQPNNATLIVTGGFDPDVVTRLVHQTFDRWQGKGDSVPVQQPQGNLAHYAAADQSSVVTLQIDWRSGATDEHHEARNILANTLNSISGQVYARHFARRQGGMYRLIAKFDPTDAPAKIPEVIAQIPLVTAGAPRERTAFASAVRRQARAELGALSTAQWASRILFAIENGHDVAWLAGSAKRIARVTYDDIAVLASTELTPDRATWLISGPRDAVTAVYAQLGVTPTWLTP
jgi:predicted Zn-dependent peptidase